jgi:hypothetical protein
MIDHPCRLPAPRIEETAPCFIVRDHNGQALAFVYCEDEPGRRTAAKLLTRDEARRIAAKIAKLRARRPRSRQRLDAKKAVAVNGATPRPSD